MVQINNLSQVLEIYNQVKVYRSETIDGSYEEITDADTRIDIIPEENQYFYSDLNGGSTHYYKTSYYHLSGSPESTMSEARLGGTEEEKIGYTFGNYRPEPGEWGHAYTADDIRHTMLFGIDCVGSDVAQSEFTDAQFNSIVDEAVGEFETFLTMDIRKKVYITEPTDEQIQAMIWREGVDYTDEEDWYEFDAQQWGNYGFLQLRHWPVLSVETAKWVSPVNGEIMDLIEAGWLRTQKKMGQLNFFPKGGFAYGPYSVFGPLWQTSAGGRYPQGFKIDYTTGYKTSDFIPAGLRSTIAKYATIKALAVVGDGLMAGFSSQSVSLDGLSESFSSTQSATSAFFGARIKQYSDEIIKWLAQNRYKFGPIPMAFVGGTM